MVVKRLCPAGARLFAAVLATLSLLGLSLAAFPGGAPPVDSSPEEERIIELTNATRRAQGLPPLLIAPELMRSAGVKARDMHQRGYFSHYTPEGTSPFALMRQEGADFSAAGENLAEGPSVESLFAAWLRSPEHRKNILCPDFTHLGVGVTGRERLTAVQHFARLRTAAPP